MATNPQPARKLLRIVPNTSFDYQFQYLNGTPASSSGPISLLGLIGIWTIRFTNNALLVLTSNIPTAMGQLGLRSSQPLHLQAGILGGVPQALHSGVYFGGVDNQPTNGLIDLVLTEDDVRAHSWAGSTYTFQITDPVTTLTTTLLTGALTMSSIAATS